MTLAMLQRQFMAAIVDDVALPDPRLAAGLAVYRNAYRARLVDCLQNSYDRTWSWLGDEAFTAAACHHLIVHPPTSWTLDDAGRGFSETLAALLPDHPEAADLAWLERAMQEVFTAGNVAGTAPDEFARATSEFGEEQWAALHLEFVPSIAHRVVTTDCATLWHALGGAEFRGNWVLDTPRTVMVWRSAMRPQFRLLDIIEADCLTRLRSGSSFGELCEFLITHLGEDEGIRRAGALLGQWLVEGLLWHRTSD